MDELDRLYRRLVQNLRSGFPELLTRPIEVSQIYQQIVPYRTNRRDLGFASIDEYELALLQLLAGSRGLLTGDGEMQRALRAELDSPNPDLSAFRVFATSTVALGTDALRAIEHEPRVRSITGNNGESTPASISPREQAALAARATESVVIDVPPAPAVPAVPATPAAPSASREWSPKVAAAAPAPAPGPPPSVDPPSLSPDESSMSASRPTPLRVNVGDACRYCGGTLPEGRNVVFCPHCGHNLTVQHCPACSTELEVGWKFCVACGRDVGRGA